MDTLLPAGQPTDRFTQLTPLATQSPLKAAITEAWCRPEPVAIPWLMEQARLPEDMVTRSQALATRIAAALRARKASRGKAGLVQGLLQEFSLSSQEGIALMCLAEALLRIPDTATRNVLIRDKISHGNWKEHVGQSPSMFVNAAAWGLMLTGKLVATHSERGMTNSLGRLIAKGGEPLIRKGVDMAMRMMGEQFVTGENMAEALKHAQALETQGFRYSYDMLGEAALTAADAQRYYQDYEQAIHAIGQASNGRGVYEGPGISIKLSALHPRYYRAQIGRVMAELYPSVLKLARLARQYDIGLNIDAEETDRLELSLELLEKLCFEPELQGWKGIGFVIQAYQKRCPYVIDFVIDLARRSGQRLMIRLVKGAYWDTEIKRAQLEGMEDYPVYTRKPYTDLSYIACARKLLAAPDAVYPQFATHNAQTLATVYELADPQSYYPGQYEFQCLHGMGEPLYEQVVGSADSGKLGRPCRIYAPVGTHETLLAYLVRRLLENGANTSFVNQVADQDYPIESLVQNPVELIEKMAFAEGKLGESHPGIPMPADLYGRDRVNSQGLNLANEHTLAQLSHDLTEAARQTLAAGPMIAADMANARDIVPLPTPVLNPSMHSDLVGSVREATKLEVEAALQAAHDFAPAWADTPASDRAAALTHAADIMEAQIKPLMGILVREAGKTYANAIAEVREAVDFLRYYAAQVQSQFDNATHKPLGPVVCISPWNFPLAIFTGQVAAALAAGNTVLAKPAEQTPLIAARAIELLWQAGVPQAAVQLLPGRGETVGAQLTGDARVMGVMFTGSTEVARILQKTVAQRLAPDGQPIPLIAETGGQNAMIVDSSALTEQVVVDVLSSAFDSAGQRCSALRVLCVQEDAADRLITMLKGAMEELRLGNPEQIANDIGPVIDAEAQANIQRHIDTLRGKGRAVHQLCQRDPGMVQGTFIPPTLIELPDLADLQREVFGPVLHVVRYRREDLDLLLAQIKATGYGLTMGLHTRIDETIDRVVNAAHAGNVYINRNIVGAVVGVQPFGGEGLSGTGPKAGGPLYVYRLLSRRPGAALAQPFGVQALIQSAPARSAAASLAQWRRAQGHAVETAQPFFSGAAFELAGPTGERNTYQVLPREAVLCLADNDADRLNQLAAVLAVGSHAVWPGANAQAVALHGRLPQDVRSHITLASDLAHANFDAVLHHGDEDSLRRTLAAISQRDGAIVTVTGLASGETQIPLERLVIERALSVNTAAAGGNASLMTMA
ncbi:trifunctional transcriptional regulator/proline dehydrogenase/L-glutamate gamma-semialdehyde dehydrogenase [Bordetella genomosp. 4]|uniref:Bifunctional protein PutA n=1 Tax=Bordetella genomosp. 4 TaxID=463044 RepID=A0A261TLE7_9BORD|nr:trifunctional transcriptional regulator/proline dehydrogenase/L-glutamate gamma-semialdehyde dehydrogenase [Bordetella genomosp. 4]OZI42922.1 trifunctional transcriptional regulator/proline dehydrogenase/L-glutamate gamma-semialdehyde dehydrogenase [Bordetella genomosp. 4]OZI50486.1 trifunctional transcriptional regulator/proline dehydrogenase/L-glutamate gamma-semialdehyde dehydrogenase [Bordetella genomosp. 4]